MLNFPQSQSLNFNAPNVQCIHIVFIVFVKLRSKSPNPTETIPKNITGKVKKMSCRETLEAFLLAKELLGSSTCAGVLHLREKFLLADSVDRA